MKRSIFYLILMLCLCALPSYAAQLVTSYGAAVAAGCGTTQDLTTYTEVDPGTVFSVSASTIAITQLSRDHDAYVYKSHTLSGDFKIYQDIQRDGTSDDGGQPHWFSACDSVGTWGDIDTANGSCVGIGSWDNSLTIYELDAGTEYTSSCTSTGVANDTRRYVMFRRTGTTLYVDLYSTDALRDAEGTGDVCSDSLALTGGAKSYSYVYAVQGRDNAGPQDFDGDVWDLDLCGY